jgi:hypothetical protein
MKLDRQLGMLLLAIWLIATGVVQLTNLSFNGMHMVMAILALAAGILLVIRR